ncbi:MAG: aminomethyl-transferring glycine dehydrogenase subunit GcvPB [Candidatus Wallbacteria bacterium]|nr:aminomethyl-transferring glycine dehydrogenase subunit GcvPB [Candidatus Wallbacteria bacterium]
MSSEKLIFQLSAPGRFGIELPELDVPPDRSLDEVPRELLRGELDFPEVSQVDVVRHFTRLSALNYHIDSGMYPLGSCTMKYNPKVNDSMAALTGFAELHPLAPARHAQGALELVYRLGKFLAAVAGMDETSLVPAAGAHGELTALMMVKAHFRKKGEERTRVLVPDSAHGTNPASAAMCGFEVMEVPSDHRGLTDLAALGKALDERVALVMLTNPNTLGLFEEQILEVIQLCHRSGALVYCDGANSNALLGRARPGDMGFDVMHFNLHKTFSTPHGGGGPGAGAVCVTPVLAPYLPIPRVVLENGTYRWAEACPDSIGRIHAFYGNFGNQVRAFTYILSLGLTGLREIADAAVLNANYVKSRLQGVYDVAHDRSCMHEFVLTGKRMARTKGVKTLDVAKRLLDLGYHAPTIYFPLIVEEAMMVEPTESESVESLDGFVAAMLQIAREADENPDLVRNAPHTTVVSRFDEVEAARKPILRWQGKLPRETK